VERVFGWPGETETLHVSLDLLVGTRQYVILEIVHNDDIIVNRVVDSPSELIPVHSPQLVVPGVVSVRLSSFSEEMPTMITESKLTRLDTVIRVWGPMESPQKPSGENSARRFVHRARQLTRKRA
jgi:hypothetical protein